MNKINFKNLPDTSTPLNAENLNQLQDNVEEAINDASSTLTNYVNTKGIYESGSNANGSYIKYDDGTMICYATKSATMGAWSAAGNLYQATNTTNITFPQTFISKPVLNIQIDYTDAGFWQAWFGRSIYSATEITYLQIWRTSTGTTGTAFAFDYIAIGRWKL